MPALSPRGRALRGFRGLRRRGLFGRTGAGIAHEAAPEPVRPPGRRRFFTAATEVALLEVIPWAFDRYVGRYDFAFISTETVRENFQRGFGYDRDTFDVNQSSHPYHGSLFFNAARENGYSFWESGAFTLAGSLIWECCMENTRPSTNDLVNTTLGGMTRGEVAHRLSAMILDNQATGRNRLFREIAAGDHESGRAAEPAPARRGVQEFPNPADRFPSLVVLSADLGYRHFTGDAAHPDQGIASLSLLYGDPFAGDLKRPFDSFYVGIDASSPGGVLFTRIEERGILKGWELTERTDRVRHIFGFAQEYEYLNNASQVFGAQIFSAGLISKYDIRPGVFALTDASVMVFPLAGIRTTDFENPETGRHYDYAPGGGARVAGRLYLGAREIVALGYGVAWAHTVNGFSTNNTLQFFRGVARVPIFGPSARARATRGTAGRRPTPASSRRARRRASGARSSTRPSRFAEALLRRDRHAVRRHRVARRDPLTRQLRPDRRGPARLAGGEDSPRAGGEAGAGVGVERAQVPDDPVSDDRRRRPGRRVDRKNGERRVERDVDAAVADVRQADVRGGEIDAELGAGLDRAGSLDLDRSQRSAGAGHVVAVVLAAGHPEEREQNDGRTEEADFELILVIFRLRRRKTGTTSIRRKQRSHGAVSGPVPPDFGNGDRVAVFPPSGGEGVLRRLRLDRSGRGRPAVRGLPIEDRDRVVVDVVDLIVAVADDRQPDLSVLRDRSDHVEQHPGLGALAVVEVVHRRDVQQVRRTQTAVCVGPDVVGRAVELRRDRSARGSARSRDRAGRRSGTPAREKDGSFPRSAG